MCSLVISRVTGVQTHAADNLGALSARERIIEVAYELFSHCGVRGVGVDQVIGRAGVAKATLYRHFATKDELVLAFLDLREERWTHEFLERKTRERGVTPREQLLAFFDVLDEWFKEADFEACSFINVLLELGSEHPAGAACIRHLGTIRSVVRQLAEEAGLRDPAAFASSWHIVMKGAIIAAAEGDRDAAPLAKGMARSLIEQHS